MLDRAKRIKKHMFGVAVGFTGGMFLVTSLMTLTTAWFLPVFLAVPVAGVTWGWRLAERDRIPNIPWIVVVLSVLASWPVPSIPVRLRAAQMKSFMEREVPPYPGGKKTFSDIDPVGFDALSIEIDYDARATYQEAFSFYDQVLPSRGWEQSPIWEDANSRVQYYVRSGRAIHIRVVDFGEAKPVSIRIRVLFPNAIFHPALLVKGRSTPL